MNALTIDQLAKIVARVDRRMKRATRKPAFNGWLDTLLETIR